MSAQGSDRDAGRIPRTALVAGMVVVAGVVVSLWRPYAPSWPPVPTDLDRLAPAVADAIARYRAPRRLLGLVVQVVTVAVPVLLVATGPGRRLLARVVGRDHRGWRGPLRGAVVAVVVTGLTALASLPVQAWAGLVQDGAWQVRTASAGAWWGRVTTSAALELGTVALVGGALVWLVRRRPRAWVGDAVLLGVTGVAVVTVVWPAVVLPLTTPVQRLGSSAQAVAVRATLAEAGLGDLPVVVQERSRRDTRSNAVVHGLGPTRRVVIDDTLLARPTDEVVAVVAHEAAHQRHRDVERAVLASSLLVAVLAVAVHLWWRRPGLRARLAVGPASPSHAAPVAHEDPRVVAVALAVVAVVGTLAEPVALWQSRRVEAAADATAFTLGSDPATAVRLQRRLAIDNLTPLELPSWEQVLWWSHPTPGQRIREAVARAAVTGEPLPTRGQLVAEEQADPPAWAPPD